MNQKVNKNFNTKQYYPIPNTDKHLHTIEFKKAWAKCYVKVYWLSIDFGDFIY